MSFDMTSPTPERPNAAAVDPTTPKILGRIVATVADRKNASARTFLIRPRAARQYLQCFVWEFHTSNTTSLFAGGIVVSPLKGTNPPANLPIQDRNSMTPLSAEVGRTALEYESVAPTGWAVRYAPVWVSALSCPWRKSASWCRNADDIMWFAHVGSGSVNCRSSLGIFFDASFTMTILPTWLEKPGRDGEEYSSRYCRAPSSPKGALMST
mmetsp:Transcript_38127/g.81347  ORF Transcript_38127/g.81347 Transcript_38127/m.81347 type:complete len:211 (-) Transcript_38127:248-880(-)